MCISIWEDPWFWLGIDRSVSEPEKGVIAWVVSLIHSHVFWNVLDGFWWVIPSILIRDLKTARLEDLPCFFLDMQRFGFFGWFDLSGPVAGLGCRNMEQLSRRWTLLPWQTWTSANAHMLSMPR